MPVLTATSKTLATIARNSMITSAEEFIKLRASNSKDEQDRATHEAAEISVWWDVINKYPDYKTWVVHNKTVPVEILELLAQDPSATIRSEVARKRKISDMIFKLLAKDPEEAVRHALISNRKLPKGKLHLIQISGSAWLQAALKDRLSNE